MESPLLISLSGANALSRRMDVVANNIANSNSIGFKAQNMLFMTQPISPVHGETLDFVIDRSTYNDLTAGPVQQTGNPLDVALTGPGYLSVKDKTGTTVYSRAGSLKLSPDGQMVDSLGNPVLSDGGDAVTVPEGTSNIAIAQDGTVSGDKGVIGKLQISEFKNPQGLIPVGNGYFSASGQAPTGEVTQTTMIQGSIEQSNVQPVLEMTQMLDISRQYQTVMNIMNQEHDRITNAIKTLGKVSA